MCRLRLSLATEPPSPLRLPKPASKTASPTNRRVTASNPEWSGYRDQASTDAANDRQAHRTEEEQNREALSRALSTELFEKVTSTAAKISTADSKDDSNAVAGYSAAAFEDAQT